MVGISNRCVDAIAINTSKEQLVSGLSRLDCDSGSAELRVGCIDWVLANINFGIQARTNPGTLENGQRAIVETLVSLLPTEKSSSIPLSFLFGMLRMAIMVDATIASRLELERRIAFRLDMVSLDDLLIPSVQAGDSLFDVDTVHRILVHFLQRIEEEENEDHGYESEGLGSPSHGCVLKVGRLVDAYLSEIAPDPYLSLQKFIAMIEVLPDYARVIDDGLYRAVDIYLKAHPMLTENECKKLCKFIDCQKLSQEACNHAAQNDRLPVQMAVRVLYFEQVRLRNALSGSSGDGFSVPKNQQQCS
ncbi:hypothetical protein F0562_017806 [Nyssa sinensis]|uniref:NPH3 domain-containing protein n=1 Tax=Nyssa sinensis TaxID=561372 RepID=A0A5J4ZIB5_9ASTE|nr:hypothetical protein F0562_017806 [Nyssa sinensis]